MRRKVLSLLVLATLLSNTIALAEEKKVEQNSNVTFEAVLEPEPVVEIVVPTLAITIPEQLTLNPIPYGQEESDTPNLFTISSRSSEDVKVYFLGINKDESKYLDENGVKQSTVLYPYSKTGTAWSNFIRWGLKLPETGLTLNPVLSEKGVKYTYNEYYKNYSMEYRTYYMDESTTDVSGISRGMNLIGTLPKPEEGMDTSADFEFKLQVPTKDRMYHKFKGYITFKFEIPYTVPTP